MDVRYISTTSDKLSELPIANGQLIYLSDLNATYYDMGSSRRLMSSMRVVSSLPSTSAAQEGVLYGIINNSGHVDASIWDASARTYRQLAGYIATASSVGLVKPDGTTITIDANGVISSHSSGSGGSADQITYDHTSSGLTSSNVQGAIDEVNTKATNAATTAGTASSTANTALTRANSATSTANTALTRANSATSMASSLESRVSALETAMNRVLVVESGNS